MGFLSWDSVNEAVNHSDFIENSSVQYQECQISNWIALTKIYFKRKIQFTHLIWPIHKLSICSFKIDTLPNRGCIS
jgi:hypothetical protein